MAWSQIKAEQVPCLDAVVPKKPRALLAMEQVFLDPFFTFCLEAHNVVSRIVEKIPCTSRDNRAAINKKIKTNMIKSI